MKRIVMLWLSLTLATLSCATNAQIIDQVTFTGIEPSTPLSDIDETRSFTVSNSGEVLTLIFNGTITPIDEDASLISFASDFIFNLSGPNIQATNIQLSDDPSLPETISFEGSVQITGSIEEGDLITFDFIDTFDDGSALTNATIDVTFEFSEEGIVIPELGPFAPELPEGIDQVIFTDILPSTPLDFTEEIRNFTATNSGTISQLFFTGRITALDPGSFPSDFLVDINGPDLSVNFIQLSEINSGFQTILVEGFIDMSAIISEGDNIAFNFRDIFDDGSNSPNAIIDIAFVFIGGEPSDLVISDFGNFTLDEGFYDRNFEGGINDHPYTTVTFEVSENGVYSIESLWGLDSFGQQFDGFLYLFDQPFDGIDDSNNIAFNDDFLDISSSRIDNLPLEKGVVYTALLTSFTSFGNEVLTTDLQGDLRVLSVEGNTASLVDEQPELCFPIKAKDNSFVLICL